MSRLRCTHAGKTGGRLPRTRAPSPGARGGPTDKRLEEAPPRASSMATLPACGDASPCNSVTLWVGVTSVTATLGKLWGNSQSFVGALLKP